MERMNGRDLCAFRAVSRLAAAVMPCSDSLYELKRVEWLSCVLSDPASGDLRQRASDVDRYVTAIVTGTWRKSATRTFKNRLFPYMKCTDGIMVYLTEAPGGAIVHVWRLPCTLREISGDEYTWNLSGCSHARDVYECVIDAPTNLITFFVDGVEGDDSS